MINQLTKDLLIEQWDTEWYSGPIHYIDNVEQLKYYFLVHLITPRTINHLLNVKSIKCEYPDYVLYCENKCFLIKITNVFSDKDDMEFESLQEVIAYMNLYVDIDDRVETVYGSSISPDNEY